MVGFERFSLTGLLVGATLLVSPQASMAEPRHHWLHHDPAVFHRDRASSIGHARQHYDRRMYNRYSGNPGAQFELRQKRQNLCRNVPEMC